MDRMEGTRYHFKGTFKVQLVAQNKRLIHELVIFSQDQTGSNRTTAPFLQAAILEPIMSQEAMDVTSPIDVVPLLTTEPVTVSKIVNVSDFSPGVMTYFPLPAKRG